MAQNIYLIHFASCAKINIKTSRARMVGESRLIHLSGLFDIFTKQMMVQCDKKTPEAGLLYEAGE
jgi:hypothetical protein